MTEYTLMTNEPLVNVDADMLDQMSNALCIQHLCDEKPASPSIIAFIHCKSIQFPSCLLQLTSSALFFFILKKTGRNNVY
jgi:hypothetical protein